MPSRIVDYQQEQTKRELRLRIGRMRRRIDGRLRGTGRAAGRLTSWRTYVRGYPGHAAAAAFGIGLALSAGLGARRLSRRLGIWLLRRAGGDAWRRFQREFAQIWSDATPKTNAKQTAGADRERA